jgi:glycosyltransferase involved in cell wall biosynthesis
MNPLAINVTAAITTYNRPETLGRAIESVLRQSKPVAELVVVDNGGFAATGDVVRSYAANPSLKIRLVRETVPGVSAARNRGIKEAQSTHVAFLDDDDVWASDHIESFLLLAHEAPGLALFSGWTARYGDPARKPDYVKPELLREYEPQNESKLLVRRAKPIDAPFFTPHMSTTVVDRRIASGVLFAEDLHGREDILFVWQLGELGAIVIHDQAHAYLDQTDASLFSTSVNASESDRKAMALKKSYWGVAMMEKIASRQDLVRKQAIRAAIRSAYFDHAHANLLCLNTNQAIRYCLKSAGFGLQLRHLRLLARSALTVARFRGRQCQ